MSAAKAYSQRLGAIGDEQFEAVAARLNLGRFIRTEPVTAGLFGQNVFVTTSEGKFVLRGAPHWVKALGETGYRRENPLAVHQGSVLRAAAARTDQGAGAVADAARRGERYLRLALCRHAAHAGDLFRRARHS